MPTYEQVFLRDAQNVSVCSDCGAVVYNMARHNEYHAQVPGKTSAPGQKEKK